MAVSDQDENKPRQLNHRSDKAIRSARVRSPAHAVLTGLHHRPAVSLYCVDAQ
jgi:hypothetical protein